MEKQEVKFIMKKGKVIPIKLKAPSKENQRSGIAKIGASVAVAGVGAALTKTAFNRSSDLWKRYANQSALTDSFNDIYKSRVNELTLFERQDSSNYIKKLKTGQRKTLKKALRWTKGSRKLLGRTIGLSSLLFGSALTDLTPRTGNEAIDDKADEIGGIAAGAFAVAVPYMVGRFTKVRVKAKSADRLFQAWTRSGKRMSAKARIKRRKDIVREVLNDWEKKYGG